MDEKFLVRVDEERPSDDKIEIRFVDVYQTDVEYKKRLDALVERLDGIASLMSREPSVDVLKDVKDVVSGLNESVKSLDDRYKSVSDGVWELGGKVQNQGHLMDDLAAAVEEIEGLRETIDKKYYDINDGIQGISGRITKGDEAVAQIKESVENLVLSSDRKYYDINDNIQDIRDKINKRGDIEPLREMLADLAIHVDNLAQRYETAAQGFSDSQMDRNIMDRHISSELENIQNVLAGQSAAPATELVKSLESVKKSVTNAVNRAGRSNQKTEKAVREFNAYLARLNSLDYMLRLLSAKNMLKTKKRVPKWAVDKKKILEKLIVGLEDEVADVLIVNAVPKTGITVAELGKAIGRTRRKTIERVSQLIAAGFMDERTVNRRKLYFLVG